MRKLPSAVPAPSTSAGVSEPSLHAWNFDRFRGHLRVNPNGVCAGQTGDEHLPRKTRRTCVRGGGRREPPGPDLGLELHGQPRPPRVGAEAVEERVGDLGPHPVVGLAGPAGGELAGGVERGPELLDRRATRRSTPVPSSAEHWTTRGSQAGVRGRTRSERVRVVGRGDAGDGLARSPSALLTTTRSASSMIPRLMPCSSSPPPGAISSTKQSTIAATATSDWPTPTVSTSTTSKPAASQSSIASRVRRATPPSVPPVGDGRTNAARPPHELAHAGLVAEDRSAAARARRVDREHRDPVAALDRRAGRAPRSTSTCRRPVRPDMPTRTDRRSRAGPRRAASSASARWSARGWTRRA